MTDLLPGCDNYAPRCGFPCTPPDGDRSCLNCNGTLWAHEERNRLKVKGQEIPMSERHEVRITNTVIHVVHLDNTVVLDKEDRSTRCLFFDDLESAEMFISSLADPCPVEPDPFPGLCPAFADFGKPDGVKRCDLEVGHYGQHRTTSDAGFWTWP